MKSKFKRFISVFLALTVFCISALGSFSASASEVVDIDEDTLNSFKSSISSEKCPYTDFGRSWFGGDNDSSSSSYFASSAYWYSYMKELAIENDKVSSYLSSANLPPYDSNWLLFCTHSSSTTSSSSTVDYFTIFVFPSSVDNLYIDYVKSSSGTMYGVFTPHEYDSSLNYVIFEGKINVTTGTNKDGTSYVQYDFNLSRKYVRSMDYDTLHVVYSYPTMRIDPSYSTYLMYSDFDNIYFSDNTIAYTKDITVSAPFTVSYTPELSENMTSNLYDSSGNMLATKNNKITANVSLSPEFLNATDDLSDTMPDYANSTYAIVAFISKSQITVDSKFPDCYNDGVLFATTKSNYYVGDDINFGVSCIQYIPRNDVLTIEFDLSQIDYYSHGISEDDPLYVNFVGLFVKQAYTSSEYLNTQLSLGNLTDITNFKNIAYPYLATSLYSYGYTSSLDEESLRKFVIQENLPSNISDELKTFILELVGGGSASALLNLFTGNKNSNDTDYDFTASSIDEYLSNFSTDNIVEDSTQLLLKYYSTYCISDKFCYSDETDETVKYPSYDESISTKGGNSVTLSVNTGKNVTNNDNKTITIGDKTYNYTYNPSTSTFDEITNVYPEKQTNETLIATYYNNNYSNTTVVSPSDSSSSSDNSSSSETVSGSGSTTIINNVVYNYDYSSSYETPEDYQQTVNNTEINKNLGTFDFDVTDISGIFDGTSDFFKFLTAGINILPSYFLTILVAFFVIMLAIVVIKWIL